MNAMFPGSEVVLEVIQLATNETEEPTLIDEVESVVIEHLTPDTGEEFASVADQVIRTKRSDESESRSCVGETKFEVAEASAVSSTERVHGTAPESAISSVDGHPIQDSLSSTSGDSAEESRATILL